MQQSLAYSTRRKKLKKVMKAIKILSMFTENFYILPLLKTPINAINGFHLMGN